MSNTQNQLYYGDNLAILREYLPDQSVDLIYLDPPFNSARDYNVLFKDEGGQQSEAQIKAFKDTWHWDITAERTYFDLVENAPPEVSAVIGALLTVIGRNQLLAYLVMMTVRLVELRRVLKPTGSIYLHCDPTASHYLKIVMDAVFGIERFRNEIIWERHEGHSDAKGFGRVHDVILHYQRSSNSLFRPVYVQYSSQQLKRYKLDQDGRLYTGQDLTGAGATITRTIDWRGVLPGKNRHWMWSIEEMERLLAQGRILLRKDGKPRKDGYKVYLDEMPGKAVGDVWIDINRIPNTSSERLGYPTQKPLALLERIIQASSNPGDVILDPFCGCGTATVAAHKLDRRWIGIDITHLSVALQKYRLKDMFGLEPSKDYAVIGEPTDTNGARQLASEDRYQFQWWALSLIPGAKPLGGEDDSKRGKKGSDRGIDGVIPFVAAPNGKMDRVIVQVKSGKVKSGDMCDLAGTLTRENAAMAIFITLEPATREMNTEAAAAGLYRNQQSAGKPDYPRLQIRTVEQLMRGEQPELPITGTGYAYKQAQRINTADAVQPSLFDDIDLDENIGGFEDI